jgi:hypothetical protein
LGGPVGVDLDHAGLRVVSIRGIDNVEVFEDQLRRLREEEIFVVVCLDHDPPGGGRRARHVRKLEEYQRGGLLPVDSEVWEPNFVEHNFSVAEVVAIANAEAERLGTPIHLTPEDVEHAVEHDEHGARRQRRKTVEDAISGIAVARVGVPVLRKGEG